MEAQESAPSYADMDAPSGPYGRTPIVATEWCQVVEHELGLSALERIRSLPSEKGEFDTGFQMHSFSEERERLLVLAVLLFSPAGQVQHVSSDIATAAALLCRGLDLLRTEESQDARDSSVNKESHDSRPPNLGLCLVGRACIIAARIDPDFGREVALACSQSGKCEALAACHLPANHLPKVHAQFGRLLSMACRLGAHSGAEFNHYAEALSRLGSAIGSCLCTLYDVRYAWLLLDERDRPSFRLRVAGTAHEASPETCGESRGDHELPLRTVPKEVLTISLLRVLQIARRNAGEAVRIASGLPHSSVRTRFTELAHLCLRECSLAAGKVKRDRVPIGLG